MVSLKIIADDNMDRRDLDIFRAAKYDDPEELRRAVESGQTLNDTEETMSFTPIHVAIIRRNLAFLDAAMAYDFDPWLRDINQRTAFDHAYAHGLREIQEKLFRKMYPVAPNHIINLAP